MQETNLKLLKPDLFSLNQLGEVYKASINYVPYIQIITVIQIFQVNQLIQFSVAFELMN